MSEYWTCKGSFRGGCGKRHQSLETSHKCIARDHVAVSKHGGRTDRRPVRVEEEEKVKRKRIKNKIKTKTKQVCTGGMLVRWRIRQGLSRVHLAVMLEVSYETVCRNEQRRGEPISDVMLSKLQAITADPESGIHIVPAKVMIGPIVITKPIDTADMEVPA